jgi:hypothetical protein
MGVGTISDAAFERVGSVLLRALDGMSVEQLRTQPAGPESNPMGWLAFHLSRVHDRSFSAVAGKEQVWVEGKWYEKFGLTAETGSLGGSTLDQVRAFDPISAELLSDYWKAVRERSREFLLALTEEDLKTPTAAGVGPPNQPETWALTVARVIGDTHQHVGQVAYARGLVGEHGWYGA